MRAVPRGLLNKPYYLFRPSQLARRIAGRLRPRREPAQFVDVRLPWGSSIRVRPDETVGASIHKIGLLDLCVSEAIWRLLDAGETAVDVGANIGHMTSAMAIRVGPAGSVAAFEPHPEVFGELNANVARWREDRRAGRIELHEIALSDREGAGRLNAGEAFTANRGSAALLSEGDDGFASAHEVPLARLDGIFTEDIAVMKLDVEGHELEVLRGAEGLLRAGRVRDILFEEWEPLPTPVGELLGAAGYSLFSLDQTLLGPSLGLATERSALRARQAPSYLATRDPQRAVARFGRKGWAVLRARVR